MRGEGGRKNTRRMVAIEARRIWGFKEGVANSLQWCSRVKEGENSKWTVDQGDVETMVSTMKAALGSVVDPRTTRI